MPAVEITNEVGDVAATVESVGGVIWLVVDGSYYNWSQILRVWGEGDGDRTCFSFRLGKGSIENVQKIDAPVAAVLDAIG